MTVMKDNQDERADLGKHESPIDAVNPLTDLQLFTRILLDAGVRLPSGEKDGVKLNPIISDEVIAPSQGDLLGQIQRRHMDAFIASRRAELAAVTDDHTAWMVYPPTPHDGPSEWAPYWSRLTDVVT
jgi:hypothetical protein